MLYRFHCRGSSLPHQVHSKVFFRQLYIGVHRCFLFQYVCQQYIGNTDFCILILCPATLQKQICGCSDVVSMLVYVQSYTFQCMLHGQLCLELYLLVCSLWLFIYRMYLLVCSLWSFKYRVILSGVFSMVIYVQSYTFWYILYGHLCIELYLLVYSLWSLMYRIIPSGVYSRSLMYRVIPSGVFSMVVYVQN